MRCRFSAPLVRSDTTKRTVGEPLAVGNRAVWGELDQSVMGGAFPVTTLRQVRQAPVVMTAWIEGDDQGHPLVLDVIAYQVTEGGSHALADLAFGLGASQPHTDDTARRGPAVR